MSELFIEGSSEIEIAHEANRVNREARRKDTTTDADIQRIMSMRTPTLPLSAEVRAAARARADQLPH